MTTRQPIRRKSWGAWFPIVRGEASQRNVGVVVSAAVYDQAFGYLVPAYETTPEYRADEVAANRKRWGMKP